MNKEKKGKREILVLENSQNVVELDGPNAWSARHVDRIVQP
jgi:predicted methyltransferase